MSPEHWDALREAVAITARLWCLFTLPGVVAGYCLARWQMGRRATLAAQQLEAAGRVPEAVAVLRAWLGRLP